VVENSLPALVVSGITDQNVLACLARSRTYGQYQRGVNDALQGKCPFCEIDPEYNVVDLETEFWCCWPCKPAEKGTRLHFLFAPHRHVVSFHELTNGEILDFLGEDGLRQRMWKRHGYTSCGALMRDGDATLSAGTMRHLHWHDMVPDGTVRVESPFYKGADEEIAGVRRAIVFERLRQSGVHAYEAARVAPGLLIDEELDLVADRLK